MNGRAFTLTVACLALATTLTALVIVDLRVASLARSVERLALRIEQIERKVEVGDVIHSHVSGGVTRTLVTQRNPGESNSDWIARHLAAVEKFLAQYPPD